MAKVEKSLTNDLKREDVASAIDKINEHTITPLEADDVFTFDVILCDNEVDRVGDKMTDEFLQSFAEKSKSLIGLKNHDWNSENAMNRLYDVEIVETEEKTSLGENRKYVLGHAYTLKSNPDVERINAGLLAGVSVSFSSEGDTCSICGGKTEKGVDDIAVCEHGHVAGRSYDGQLCFNRLCNCSDVYEWSLVPVPCQRGACIKNKNLGGMTLMKKAKFLASKLFAKKSFDEEVKNELTEIIETPEETEISEEDVNALLEENAKLKSELDAVKKELEEIKAKAAEDKACGAVRKAVEELDPLTEQVTEDIIDKIDMDKISIDEEGNVVGLDDQIEVIKKAYNGLFKVKSVEKPAEEKKEEAPVVIKKGFNPTFGVGNKANASKKSFHDACTEM